MTCEDDVLCDVNKPATKDVEEMNDLEKKHAVIIEAPAKVKEGELFEVEVRAGEYMKHPNKPTHFIEWMELCDLLSSLERGRAPQNGMWFGLVWLGFCTPSWAPLLGGVTSPR